MGVSGDTSATGELLLAGGADENGVGECAEARGIKRAHVEDVNALHLAENFETLETSRLLDIGRDGAGGGTGAEKVVNGLDLCVCRDSVSALLFSSSHLFDLPRYHPEMSWLLFPLHPCPCEALFASSKFNWVASRIQ